MNRNALRLKKSALSGAILGVLGTAQAATINVDGACTLVDAMESANTDTAVGSCTTGSGADVIQVVSADSAIQISTSFESSIAGPGDVGLPIVDSNITIEGNGMNLQAVAPGFRMFEVITGGSLTLRDTTVTGANDTYGIGSGLLSYYGQVTIENSTFALNNSGILIVNSYANQINNSVIRHNRSSSNFAAGFQSIFSEVEINNTSMIDSRHDYTGYVRCSLQFADGAGLLQSVVSITNSTISGNQSFYCGGIIVADDTPPPVPSRFGEFGNAPLRGVIQSNVKLTNSTISNNKGVLGAGIFDISDYGGLTLQGSIVAGNKAFSGGSIPEIFVYGGSTVYLDANNIIGDNGQTGSFNITLGASDQSFSNYAADNLYPLTVSQGQLMHPLKVGSVAIDGNDLSCFGSATDQEGKGRGIDGDDDGSFICDIGSFEHSLPIMADGAPCGFFDALEAAENDTSVNGCQPGNGHDIIMLPNESTVTFTNIVDNPSPGSYYNFGAQGIDTAVTIEANGSTFQRDPGAVEDFDLLFANTGGQLNLIDANVTGANGGLGAVASWFEGNINVINSVVSNNQNCGVFDVGSINSSVVNTTVSNNTYNIYGVCYSFSPLTALQSVGFELRHSTISGNTGGAGGGVDFRSTVMATMENTTISGNTAFAAGGMIVSSALVPFFGTAAISNATITGNTAGSAGGLIALMNQLYTSTTMSHSIVSGNELSAPVPPVGGRSVVEGPLSQMLTLDGVINSGSRGGPGSEINLNGTYLYLDDSNIVGENGAPGTYNVSPGSSDIVPAGPTSTVIDTNLADNGGATLTHLPVAGGDAVDAGDANCELNTDQTGRIRPWDGDGDGNENCDIGAVEFGSIYASDIIFKDGFDPLIIIRRGSADN